MNRIPPDFKEWAKNISDRTELEEALEQAYTQGYTAGNIDATNDWWQEQDLAYAQADKEED